MKVLIGCEYSGITRKAFYDKGHDATSCDLLPTEIDGYGKHYQGDVRDIIGDGWDLAIFHPDCTYLANSGVRWLYEQPERWQKTIEGAVFFRELLEADIPMIAVENPIIHKWAKMIIGREQDQTIQPYQFGHPERKATCLWLKGLPLLRETENVKHIMDELPAKESNRIHYMSPGPDRGKERSKSYSGIAHAMATQWTDAHNGRLEK